MTIPKDGLPLLTSICFLDGETKLSLKLSLLETTRVVRLSLETAEVAQRVFPQMASWFPSYSCAVQGRYILIKAAPEADCGMLLVDSVAAILKRHYGDHLIYCLLAPYPHFQSGSRSFYSEPLSTFFLSHSRFDF